MTRAKYWLSDMDLLRKRKITWTFGWTHRTTFTWNDNWWRILTEGCGCTGSKCPDCGWDPLNRAEAGSRSKSVDCRPWTLSKPPIVVAVVEPVSSTWFCLEEKKNRFQGLTCQVSRGFPFKSHLIQFIEGAKFGMLSVQRNVCHWRADTIKLKVYRVSCSINNNWLVIEWIQCLFLPFDSS